MSRDASGQNGSARASDLRENVQSLQQAHSRAEKFDLRFVSYLVGMTMSEVGLLLNAVKNQYPPKQRQTNFGHTLTRASGVSTHKKTGKMLRSCMSVRSRLAFAGLTGLAASFAVVMSLSTNTALSAGGITCQSQDGKAEISINFARLPIYAPSAAAARLGEKRWASVPQLGETELGSSQGMIEQDRFSADFADKDAAKIIISLRVPSLAAGEDDGVPATLTFEDGVPRAALCQFE